MKQDNRLCRLLLDWALICLGVFGSLFCVITAFDLPVPGVIWVLVPLLSLGLGLLFQGKSGKYWALGSLALLLLAGWLLRRELLEAFRNLWGLLCGRYILGYDQFLDFMPREEVSPEASVPALICLAVLEAWLSTLSVRLWRRSFPVALALLPGIVPCFILTDTPPALLPLMAAAFSLLTQAFSQSVRRRAMGEENRAILLAALLSAGILAVLLAIFPEKNYEPPISWDELNREMERFGREQGNRGNLLAGLGGSPDEVDLSALGALPNRPIPALYVTSSREGYVYLRNSSYTAFDGTNWTRGELEDWDQSALFPYLSLSDGESLTVETVEQESKLYTTYQLTTLPGGGRVVSDAYVENLDGRQRYTMRWQPEPGSVSPDPAYDQWVRAHCLELPEQTRQGVLAWWEAQGGGALIQDEAHLQALAELVSQTAVYSRNPLRMPAGADFCTWFLNEAQEGYCVHFASSCTALLRALGVPARYVTGYVIYLSADTRCEVTNLQAHAWVEVWLGGHWVQLEPTPEDATEFSGTLYTPGTRPVSEPETTALPTERGGEPLTDTLPPWTETRSQSTRDSVSPSTAPSGGGSGSGSAAPRNLTLLWCFLGAAGLLALILGHRALALGLWERRLARTDVNGKARLYYRRIQRFHAMGGGEIPPEAERLAKRAGFSQHELEAEELRFLRQLCDQQGFRVCNTSIWKKLYVKYILALI